MRGNYLKFTYKKLSERELIRELNTNGSVSIELTLGQFKKCITFFKVFDNEKDIGRFYSTYMIVKLAITALFFPKLINVISFYIQEQPTYDTSTENGKTTISFSNK